MNKSIWYVGEVDFEVKTGVVDRVIKEDVLYQDGSVASSKVVKMFIGLFELKANNCFDNELDATKAALAAAIEQMETDNNNRD